MHYRSRYWSDYGYSPIERSGYYGSWLAGPLDLPPLAQSDDQPAPAAPWRPSWLTRLLTWAGKARLSATRSASPEHYP